MQKYFINIDIMDLKKRLDELFSSHNQLIRSLSGISDYDLRKTDSYKKREEEKSNEK